VKNVLWVVLPILLSVGLSAVPAAAETSEQPAPVAPALDLCSEQPLVSSEAPEPLLLEPNGFVLASSCTVYQQCDDGRTIQCTGTTCSAGPGTCGGWIDCDGQVTDCGESQGSRWVLSGCCSSTKGRWVLQHLICGVWQNTQRYICSGGCLF
jgi:hypothetical protein